MYIYMYGVYIVYGGIVHQMRGIVVKSTEGEAMLMKTESSGGILPKSPAEAVIGSRSPNKRPYHLRWRLLFTRQTRLFRSYKISGYH